MLATSRSCTVCVAVLVLFLAAQPAHVNAGITAWGVLGSTHHQLSFQGWLPQTVCIERHSVRECDCGYRGWKAGSSSSNRRFFMCPKMSVGENAGSEGVPAKGRSKRRTPTLPQVGQYTICFLDLTGPTLSTRTLDAMLDLMLILFI
ncbi:unnamed protein product [Discosporangium mesarthrocarpum]